MRQTRFRVVLLTLVAASVFTIGAAAEAATESAAAQLVPTLVVDERVDGRDAMLVQSATRSCPVESVATGSVGVRKLAVGMGAPCLPCDRDEECKEWGAAYCGSVGGAFCAPLAPSCASTLPACQCGAP